MKQQKKKQITYFYLLTIFTKNVLNQIITQDNQRIMKNTCATTGDSNQ